MANTKVSTYKLHLLEDKCIYKFLMLYIVYKI